MKIGENFVLRISKLNVEFKKIIEYEVIYCCISDVILFGELVSG